MEKEEILLPGLNYQVEFLFKYLIPKPEKILIAGSGAFYAASLIAAHFNTSVDLIVEDYQSLLETRLLGENNPSVNIKMMSFENTDYAEHEFDLIYAQASVSTPDRNKIIKEFKRILKPGGHLCVGEMVHLSDKYPAFIKDIYANSYLNPLKIDELKKYYVERKFKILQEKNLSYTLKDYYREVKRKLEKSTTELDPSEKSYYKKTINRIKHEAYAYLNLGASKHIGFYLLLLQKD
ncbi:class I SAM-dependent methyltransferase [Melioribacter sp. OK-6-Me]|uniref:class I SAM-dependent methyltransferase n=1 Tax=unclassified Melioribacter TaxID=2627329 RepID=UPI003ED8D846